MIKFHLPDMTCKHCERSVTEAVQQVEPGVGVKIDLDTHMVAINTNREPAAFVSALVAAGYPPADASA
ncbi:MAG: heavy-metal-associated domain-containing protein [Lautropia sp.]|nr:heavy-metal-associated domain-containing protein [Lautropia sp.]